MSEYDVNAYGETFTAHAHFVFDFNTYEWRHGKITIDGDATLEEALDALYEALDRNIELDLEAREYGLF